MDLAALLLALLLLVHGGAAQSDVECLREFKASVQVTSDYLQSWSFGSKAGGVPNICNFIGVQCLHPSEIKVYSLSLPGAGLRGTFPKGLDKCRSLTGLDLSGNQLRGPIPPAICQMLPYLVKLDLSTNNISGGIPEGLGSCLYLNELRLHNNSLAGAIPGQIGLLSRLRDFDVANNRLSGPIPYTFARAAAASNGGAANPAGAANTFSAASFEGNDGLCGPPLRKACAGGAGGRAGGGKRRRGKAGAAVIAGVAVGGAVAAATTAVAAAAVVVAARRRRRGGAGGPASGEEVAAAMVEDTSFLRRVSPAQVVVSMFEQPLVKLRLSDLAAATGGFSRESVLCVSRSGVTYKAVLRDGSQIAVKRLRRGGGGGAASHGSGAANHGVIGERQFRTEMEALGKARHRNLVPLLGYVAAAGERMLLYKHMSGGSLREALRSEAGMEWGVRLRAALGAARGLAWLHHSCSPKIVHRHITSGTILLDDDLEPRITDFGLARLINLATTRPPPASGGAATTGGGAATTVGGAATAAGLPGASLAAEERLYVAPEEVCYSSVAAPVATAKGDVYSLGVVLLEVVTGRRAWEGEGGRSLVEWIGDLFKTGHVSEAVDRRLVAAEAAAMAAAAAAAAAANDGCASDNSSSGSGRRREVMQVLKIACSCVLSFPKERPSMYEVYHMLRGVGEDYYYPHQHQHQQQQHLRRHHLRQVDDYGDIAAASAVLATNGNDDHSQASQQQQQQQQRPQRVHFQIEQPQHQQQQQQQEDEQQQQQPSAAAAGATSRGSEEQQPAGGGGVQLQRFDV